MKAKKNNKREKITKRAPKIDIRQFGKGFFLVTSIAIIFDTSKRKILIGKREKDPFIKKLTWGFPSCRPTYHESIDDALKRRVKEKTGMRIVNLGPVFARILDENNNFILIYYLCEVTGGKEKPGDDIVKLKWVKPQELEKHFTTSFDSRLKEYIMNLR